MQNTKISPKDFFLHIGVVISLYAIVVALINLVWSIINYSLPLSTAYYSYATQSYSVPVGVLIVVFPIFILLSWLLNREYKLTPEKRDFWLRKWLLYLTLFIAAIVIIVDLIVLLISFLGGEFITTNFLLKILSVFVITAFVFWFYISDIRNKLTSKTNKISTITAAIIILVMIVLAFSIMGSPKTQRFLRADQQKISDLQSIQWQIVYFWQQKQVLPQNLEEMVDPISGFVVPIDPQTKEQYNYEIKGALSFELCAEFNLAQKSNLTGESERPTEPFIKGGESGVWNHEEGYQCFERTIDPELYPPTKR